MSAVEKDEWSPMLKKLRGATTPQANGRRLKRCAFEMVALLRIKMTRQEGFADNTPYPKLRIKWRYDGTKDVIASKRNMRRAIRGAKVKTDTFVRMVGGVTHVKQGRTIAVRARTKVTASTLALIHHGDLRRSWDVLRATNTYVDIGNKTPLEKVKAYYNDNRGKFSWGRASEEAAFAKWVAEFDRLFEAGA